MFHVLRWVLPPLMSQTFQCVTAMCFSPQESTEGPHIQVRESCQGRSSAWIPAVAHIVLQCVIRTLLTVVFCLEYWTMNKLHKLSNTTHRQRCSYKEQHCNLSSRVILQLVSLIHSSRTLKTKLVSHYFPSYKF